MTGLRGSLQRNLDIKRDAAGVVDSITSEEIGKFPDSNVAASLQRLPGVSIQRSGARGEPTGVTVRGFGGDFNETLYDGRRLSTATGGRSVDFSTIGADFVSRVDVLKTPDVSLSTSSIGATVNVQFPKPFDKPGFRAAVTGAGSIQDRSGRVVPTGGFLVSDTFANDTMGILADAFYTRRDTAANHVYVSGWTGGYYAPCQSGNAATCKPTSNAAAPEWSDPSNRQNIAAWFPQQYGADKSYVRDERFDARIAFQWRPSDDLTITIDDNFSKQTIDTRQAVFGVWFTQGELRNVKLDPNGTTVDFNQAVTATDFYDTRLRSINQTNQIGFNAKWNATDALLVEADASYSKSLLNPGLDASFEQGDVGYSSAISPFLGLRVTGNSKNSFPTMNTWGPNGDKSRFTDPTVMGSHVIGRGLTRNSDTIKQARLQATWGDRDFNVRVGGKYLEDSFSFRSWNTYVNNFWQAYAGFGPASGGTGNGGGVRMPVDLVNKTISLANFIPGYSGTLPDNTLKIDYRQIQGYLTGLGDPQSKNIPGFNYGSPGVGTNFRGRYDLGQDIGGTQDISERTWAAYASSHLTTAIADMPFYINAGVRYERTDLSSSGIGRVPISIIRTPADPTLLTIDRYTPNQTITTKSHYGYLLPSLDLKLELTRNLLLRFDASRTLTRPSINLLTPVLFVPSNPRVGAITASGGNPNLKPYISDNLDLGVEWYYQTNSYFAVNGFLKHVKNFIVAGVQRQTINGVIDPSTGTLAQFDVASRYNGPDATIRGVEIAWQQVFGNSGFGFNANATLVSTNKSYDPKIDLTQSGFAVTGLANSANFVGFYDKNGFQFRTALNWRDDYLLGFGGGGAFGAEPVFVNSAIQVDMSSSYDVTKDISVFGEMLNVNNSNYSTRGRFDNQFTAVYNYGRRYTAGVRFRF